MKIIIFDFDGTLGDTRANIVLTMQQTLAAMGYPPVDEEAIAATIGLPLEAVFPYFVPDISEEGCLACAGTYREIFERNRRKLVPGLFPHVRETLSLLKERGYVLTVASSRSSRSLDGFLADMDIASNFSYVLGADKVSRAKPDPEPVLKTLRDLGFPAGEAMVVGDMPVDILMGKGAGAATCAVTTGNASRQALEEAGADHIIDDLAELPAILSGTAPGSITE